MGKISNVWNKVPETYKGIVLFLLCLFGSNFFWKLTVTGDHPDLGYMKFCGLDITWIFHEAKFWFAAKTHQLSALLGVQTQLYGNFIGFSNGLGCTIIAGCTAIKQFFMLTVIILFSRGRLVHKIWYWLLSVAVLVEFNIWRLFLLTYLVRNHSEWFDFMHGYVMKYTFYCLMFLLWVIWDEWLRRKLDKRKAD